MPRKESRPDLRGLWLLLAATAAVRLLAAPRPLLGTFATKNCVYAMIARNWARGQAPFWQPTLDLQTGGERSLHLLELPLSVYLAGGAWRVFGGSLDLWGRLVSVGFSVGAVWLMFLLAGRWFGTAAAWGAAFVLAFSPVGVIYGQSFMLESSVVFFAVATLYCWSLWLEGRGMGTLSLAAVSFTLLLATKVYMVALLLPLAGILWRPPQADDSSSPKRRFVPGAAALLLAVLPVAIWIAYVWRISAPESPLADRIYYSLRQSAGIHGFPSPLLRSPDFYRQALDDLATVALTPLGLALAVLGLAHRQWRRLLPWLLASGALLVLLPLKFYRMNYYWLVALPPLCVLAGLGWRLVWRRIEPSRLATAAMVALLVCLAARWFAKGAFVTPPEDRAVLPAAEAARALAQPDEPLATLHGTTLDLLYYCDRRGWALSENDPRLKETLDDCRRRGARRLVYVATGRPTPAALRDLPVQVSGDGFKIYAIPP